MSISTALKRKRDAEERLRKLPFYPGNGGEGIVTTVDDIGTEGTGLPVEETDPGGGTDPTDPTSPTTPVANVRKFAQEYNGIIWEVNHGLQDDPVIQLWVYEASIVAFGSQAFGTSFFGGRELDIKGNTYASNAVIRKVNNNTLRIEWDATTHGKAVCIS